jgi:hypothetical protein
MKKKFLAVSMIAVSAAFFACSDSSSSSSDKSEYSSESVDLSSSSASDTLYEETYYESGYRYSQKCEMDTRDSLVDCTAETDSIFVILDSKKDSTICRNAKCENVLSFETIDETDSTSISQVCMTENNSYVFDLSPNGEPRCTVTDLKTGKKTQLLDTEE